MQLEPGEQILLEAEGTVKAGRFRQLGRGRFFLTSKTLVWLSESSPVLRRLFAWWVPDLLAIPVSEIDELSKRRDFARTLLFLRVKGTPYALHIGKGPAPLLRDNPPTADEWFEAIQRLRGKE